MGERIRQHDWRGTPLGPLEDWPQSLRSALSICLSTPYPIAIYWGPELALLYNDAWAPILGQKHPRALGRPGHEVWPEIWDVVGPQFARLLRTGETTRQRDQLLPMHRHGYVEECYFDYSFGAIRGESGQVAGVFNAVIETTYRVISERRLGFLRTLSERPVQGASDAEVCDHAVAAMAADAHDLPFAVLYLADGDGALVACAAHGIPGPALEALRSIGADGAPWAFPPGWRDASALAAPIGELPPPLRATHLGPWPEPTHAAAVTPLLVPGRGVIGCLVAGISARRATDDEYRSFIATTADHVAKALANARAFEEARRRAEELARLDRAKTAFFSNVSHEFRTPLTLMLGPLEDSLADTAHPLDPPQRERQRLIHRNAQRLLRLVNTLLDFSRIEAGRIQASFRSTDLGALTADLASTFRSAIERAGLTLTVIADLPDSVFVDHDMWEKIVLNLLSNAFKHTFRGGITVRLGAADGHARLVVEDTGVGIPAEQIPRLFERFHRVQDARSRSIEGTGIGLALVHELVKLHGGSVAVESEVDRGSRFIVDLPFGSSHLPPAQIAAGTSASAGPRANPFVEEAQRWLGEDADPDPGSAPAAAPASGAAHILVADDNADMRGYIVRLLSARWRISAVTDGEAALDLVRRDPPDLVLSDVMMPKLDGFGLLAALRRDPATAAIPLILLSARAGEEARVEGLAAGADDYLVKPFSARELLARVDAHLAMVGLRQRAAEALRRREEMLRRAVGAARMLAWSWELGTTRVECTDNIAEVFGLLPGQRVDLLDAGLALVHPDDVARHAAAINEAVRAGAPYRSVFRIVRPSDGRVVWMEEHGEVQVERDGRQRVTGVTLDVTERVESERSLGLQAEELRRSNSELEQFAYVASHDLKEPLRMISQFMSLLDRRFGGQLPPEARRYVEHAVSGASRMNGLIEDLLAFSRAGRAVDPTEAMALDEVIGQIEQVLVVEIERSGARIERGPLPTVRFEPTKIAQLFQNLIGNAIKFRAPGVAPRVRIAAENRGEHWEFSVADNGIGIPPEHAARIFDVFARLHGREAYPGSGIGLAICKRIVEQHRGRIWVQPAAGGGSDFRFTLPAEHVVAGEGTSAPAR